MGSIPGVEEGLTMLCRLSMGLEPVQNVLRATARAAHPLGLGASVTNTVRDNNLGEVLI